MSWEERVLKLSREEILERAGKHIFSTGLNDGASRLCRWNMKYGLAKFHVVQEKYGLTPYATFISAPDETITRNRVRWNNGIGYGGKVSWGDGEQRLIILDVMPNACGMYVGGLQKPPDIKEIIERIDVLRKEDKTIEGVKVEFDLGVGNHFISLFRVEGTAEIEFPEYAFVIHCGAPELRTDTTKAPGLYLRNSESLQNMAECVETPFGPCYVLIDNNAVTYFHFYKYAESFSEKRRSLVAKEIFGKHEMILNIVHQGLANYNEAFLGCHLTQNSLNEIFPITLRGDLPAYLLRGGITFNEQILEILGFSKRAEKLEVIDRLRKTSILPHGGGYALPDTLNVIDVAEIATSRYFIVETMHGMGRKVVSDIRELAFSYRGMEVLARTVELGNTEIVGRLQPICSFKM